MLSKLWSTRYYYLLDDPSLMEGFRLTLDDDVTDERPSVEDMISSKNKTNTKAEVSFL